jgi:hypothetical protein
LPSHQITYNALLPKKKKKRVVNAVSSRELGSMETWKEKSREERQFEHRVAAPG